MQFSFLNQEKQPTFVQDAQSLEDTGKREKIIATLCEKRKALEWNLANLVNRDEVKKALYETELKDHIEKMSVFGISEMDYAMYRAKKPEETIH